MKFKEQVERVRDRLASIWWAWLDNREWRRQFSVSGWAWLNNPDWRRLVAAAGIGALGLAIGAVLAGPGLLTVDGGHFSVGLGQPNPAAAVNVLAAAPSPLPSRATTSTPGSQPATSSQPPTSNGVVANSPNPSHSIGSRPSNHPTPSPTVHPTSTPTSGRPHRPRIRRRRRPPIRRRRRPPIRRRRRPPIRRPQRPRDTPTPTPTNTPTPTPTNTPTPTPTDTPTPTPTDTPTPTPTDTTPTDTNAPTDTPTPTPTDTQRPRRRPSQPGRSQVPSRPVRSTVVKFDELARHLDQLEATSSRNELVRILSEVYRACSADEIEPITYLLQGRLAPFFEPVEIGLAERLLITAIATAYGVPKEEVGKLYKQAGDLGVTAQRLAPASAGESPPVVEVHQRLYEIARAGGAGSLQKKLDLFTGLLADLDPASAKHLVRITLGKMRLGIGSPTVLDALSFAKKGDKSLRPVLEGAYNRTSDLGLIARTLWDSGERPGSTR